MYKVYKTNTKKAILFTFVTVTNVTKYIRLNKIREIRGKYIYLYCLIYLIIYTQWREWLRWLHRLQKLKREGSSMTLKELSHLYYLNREIERDRQCLEELRSKAESPQSLTLEAIIKAKQEKCIHERDRLERFISGIDDSLTRQIFTMRYANSLSWAEIAAKVGGGNKPNSVRRRIYRAVEKIEKIEKSSGADVC
jgi:DNA-directed RNA polymerase specialized sigma24 family protein